MQLVRDQELIASQHDDDQRFGKRRLVVQPLGAQDLADQISRRDRDQKADDQGLGFQQQPIPAAIP